MTPTEKQALLSRLNALDEKRTEGEWVVAKRGCGSYVDCVAGHPIASCAWIYGQASLPAMSNAAFIAQAPAMLTLIREQEAEIAELRARCEWRDIESVPKNSAILLLDDLGKIGIGRLYDGETHPQIAVTGMGWGMCGFNDPLNPVFVKWMPLPTTPQKGEGDE